VLSDELSVAEEGILNPAKAATTNPLKKSFELLNQLSAKPYPGFQLPTLQESIRHFVHLNELRDRKAYVEVVRLDEPADDFTVAFQFLHRCLFRSLNHYLGFGNDVTKPGDSIWILENATVPFVLRSTDRRDEYRLVGECYVHGVMNGELFERDSVDMCPIALV
jgi:hypothetical protein